MELRHVLGRAGTFHLFFSFQFLPLWTGLSTLGNNMGGGGSQDGPRAQPYCYSWNECSPRPQLGSPGAC